MIVLVDAGQEAGAVHIDDIKIVSKLSEEWKEQEIILIEIYN